MNIAYLIYQAERQPSAAEQRAIDTRRGELASGLAQLMQRRPQAADRGRSWPAGRKTRRHQAVQELPANCRLTSQELACR
jgi:hypothetical protein